MRLYLILIVFISVVESSYSEGSGKAICGASIQINRIHPLGLDVAQIAVGDTVITDWNIQGKVTGFYADGTLAVQTRGGQNQRYRYESLAQVKSANGFELGSWVNLGGVQEARVVGVFPDGDLAVHNAEFGYQKWPIADVHKRAVENCRNESQLFLYAHKEDVQFSDRYCVICDEKIERNAGSCLTVTDCDHIYHYSCLENWAKTEAKKSAQVTCPLCRKLQPELYHARN